MSYLTIAEISTLVSKTAKAAQKTASAIQQALISATYHAVAHGNTEGIKAIVEGFDKASGLRVQAILGWLDSCAPVMFDGSGGFSFSRDKLEALTGAAKPTEAETEAYMLTLAENLWTDHKPEPATITSFDVNKAIASILKKAAKARKDGAMIEGEATLAQLAGLLEGKIPTKAGFEAQLEESGAATV